MANIAPHNNDRRSPGIIATLVSKRRNVSSGSAESVQKAIEAPVAGKSRSYFWLAPVCLAAMVLIFYWTPLTSNNASIQWDAADLHYPFQKYFSDHIRDGKLPFWTPYLCSGFPFLAYLETGSWYAPHWLFFLIGITPRMIEWELAANAFLACMGAYFLCLRLIPNRTAAILGGIAYGLSGFFAAHSSHVGIFSAAAGFPWLILMYIMARDSSAVRFTALGGIVGAELIFAGYFQTAMYSFVGLGILGLVDIIRSPKRWWRPVVLIAGMFAIALTIAAIQILPTLELLKWSTRSVAHFSHDTHGVLDPPSLTTLIFPNFQNAVSGHYSGAPDITLSYFYAGVLLLPFAILGLWKSPLRILFLSLIVPSVWYMLGPSAGFYSLAVHLPGMSLVREPVQGWFVVALALSMAAAAGFSWMLENWRIRFVGAAVILIFFVDLFYWNSYSNQLSYARFNFNKVYGAKEEFLRVNVMKGMPPLTRFDGHLKLELFNPLDHPLDLKLEATYGYLAMPLTRYFDYKAAMQRNQKLKNALNISEFLIPEPLGVGENLSVLPRVYVPRKILPIQDDSRSRSALETLNPPVEAIADLPQTVQQDPSATATVVNYEEEFYRIYYHAATPTLIRLSVPWYPGWRASVNGVELAVVRVDHALMGAVVPAGEGNLEMRFRSQYFATGLGVTMLGLLIAGLMSARPGWFTRR
jgi:hypothetical protein